MVRKIIQIDEETCSLHLSCQGKAGEGIGLCQKGCKPTWKGVKQLCGNG